MYKLGLASVSFRGLDADRIIDAVKDAGLSCIEWGSDVHAPCGDKRRLLHIAARCAAENIDICSYGSYFVIGKNPLSELADYICAARLLGTGILRVWAGARGSDDFSAEERARFFDECRSAAGIAEGSGVVLSLECHQNTFTDTLEGALTLMREVDSPSLRMHWQPDQYRSAAENLRYAQAIAPYTTHLHVFNWEGDRRYPLGEGVELWREYLARFRGDRCLLLEFMPDDDPATLPREADALKKIAAC